MGVEIQVIRRDRIESDRQATGQREKDRTAFEGIGKGISSAITQSQLQFEATMARVDESLKASKNAVENTRPRAILQMLTMFTNPPNSLLLAGHQVEWRVGYTNSGSDKATEVHREAAAYLASPGENEQAVMRRDFDEWWAKTEHEAHEVEPGDPVVFLFRSDVFTDDDVKLVAARRAVVYVLMRFTWRDQTGQWASDRCFFFEDASLNGAMARPCQPKYNRQRYAFRQSSR